ncbi:hypothetical protein ACFY2W_26385 [Streptomyces sp. NPDC001262]|uniref:hypothetical protein n=1 Tax=Streptomyces TaxID=1883 RepID=UPI00368ED966
MGASCRTRFLLASTVCGALALGTAHYTATAVSAPPAQKPVAETRHSEPRHSVPVPSPAALRSAAGDSMKAIDSNSITKESNDAAAACNNRVQRAEPERRRCAALQEHLGDLGRARAGLDRLSTAEHPDVDAVGRATTDAVTATVHLAQDRQAMRSGGREHPGDGAASGLLGTLQSLLQPLVNSLGRLVGGVPSIVNGLTGLLASLLGGLGGR